MAPAAAYRRLFAANALALLGAGVSTVALALLAYDLAGADAAAVLGAALGLRMAANILVAPFAAALAARLPLRGWLVALDLGRAGALLLLPFVDALWQLFVVVVLFQAASAAFAAAYAATVATLLPDEGAYAAAVAKSKIAHDAETLASPLVAALLLGFLSSRGVFVAATGAFLGSALILFGTALPRADRPTGGAFARAIDGMRALLAAPALRGALALAAGATLVAAMATVNAVPMARGSFGLDDRAAALALASFGAGGVAAALALPRLTAGGRERRAMLGGGAGMALLLLYGPELRSHAGMLALWAGLGATTTLALAPFSLLLRRSAGPARRAPLYAAHFAATNALLLVAYPAAGWAGSALGVKASFLVSAVAAVGATLAAAALWPSEEPSTG